MLCAKIILLEVLRYTRKNNMCGIAGYTGKSVEGVLCKMSALLAHRGPDATGYDNTKDIHLVHRRLKVIDLESGMQPMKTTDEQLIVIFNGEIYNHRELRSELESKGHKFQTDHSDTEVLLHGFREWGESLPERLNGMWAFCIYDKERERLFLSRDRFGQKPLFYTQTREGLVFASELTAVAAHPAVSTNISTNSLQKYFAYGFIPHPHTIYEGVFKLAGGFNLTFDLVSSKLSTKRYWSYEIEPDYSLLKCNQNDLAEELLSLLSQATKRRLESDVDLGILLSGGIDSSAIAALASKHADTVSTFSIGFDRKSYDESPYSTRVAELIKSKHYLNTVTIDKTFESLPYVLSQLDEPQGDDSLLPTYLVCKTARESVTVALGGDGGDELFSGYEPFKFWRWARRYNIYLPKQIHAGVNFLTSHIPASNNYMSLSLKLKRFFHASGLKMEVWIPALMSPLRINDIIDLLGEDTDIDSIYSEAIESWNNCKSKWVGDKITQYYVDYYLQDDILAKTDRASMMNSLELRSPFLDIDLANFARKLPHQLRIKGGTTKYLLKKALEPLLPRDILYRGKQGFSPPTGDWFANGSLAINSIDNGIINMNTAKHLLSEHKKGNNDNRLFLWNQLALDYFLQRGNE